MVFAAVLAGGVGSRMGANTPKQYLRIGGRTILSISVSKFLREPEITHVVVLTPGDWVDYTRDLLAEEFGKTDRLTVLEGGETRNDTLENAIGYLDRTFSFDENTILVTHDAVRPFLTRRILRENIEAASRYGACGTAIPATDTILKTGDGKFIKDIPDRTGLWQMQTPQSFNARKLESLMASLSAEEREVLTDGCRIFGDVEHSVLSESVIVEKGAIVKDCVLMPGVVVKEGAHIERCIVDFGTIIGKDVNAGSHVEGEGAYTNKKLCSEGICVFERGLKIKDGAVIPGNSMVDTDVQVSDEDNVIESTFRV